MLVTAAQITRRVIESLPRCKLLVRYGVGLDTLDVPAATEHGIVVAHFPDFCQPEVANHAIMLLLACAKKLVRLDRAVRDGSWRPGPLSPDAVDPRRDAGAHRVRRHRAGGHGARAGAGARCHRLRPVRPRRSVRRPGCGARRDAGGAAATLGLRLAAHAAHACDAPSPGRRAVPLYEEQHLRDQHLARRRHRRAGADRGVAGRGEVAGAGLDVFEREPLPASSPLVEMDKVVLMPHSASYSDVAFEGLRRRVGETAVAVLEGRWPDEVAVIANPDVQPRAELPPRS